MTVKANAHFVDSDIKSLTPSTWDWQQGQSIAAYKLTYFSENNNIWGFPTYGTEVRGLDAGPAVDLGDGLVGLPFTGHPFEAGWTVSVYGTTNYDTSKVLHASTSANELVIETTYQAENFDGSERVLRSLTTTSSTGKMVQDLDGNIYYGHNGNAGSYLTKITPDGTQIPDFFQPSDNYLTDGSTGRTGCVTSDGRYMYFMKGQLYKFDLLDGSEVWRVTPTNCNGNDFALDASDNLFVTGTTLTKFDATNGTLTNYPAVSSQFALWADHSMTMGGYTGVVITTCTGYVNITNPEAYPGKNLIVSSLSGDYIAGVRIGPITQADGNIYTTYVIGQGHIWTYNNYIYVVIEDENKLYKLDTSLNVVSTVTIPDIAGGYYDLWGNLVIVSESWGGSTTNLFYFYDPDTLELLAVEPALAYGSTVPMRTWDITIYQHGNILFWKGIVAQPYSRDPYIDQSRTISYPEDRRHLNGETVQVLGDGIHLDDETYTIVDGEVSPAIETTVNHIGLQVTSKLQPMKIDGEAEVKRISEIIPDVHESTGGEYGKELTDMYDMKLRDSGDPMDKDGDLHTGYVDLPFKGQFDRQADIWIQQTNPLPLHLLGLGVRLSKEAI